MKSLQELQAIRDKMKATVNIRDNQNCNMRIVVGMATCGIAAGARPVLNKFNEEILKRDIQGVMVSQTGCIGVCQYEPIAEIYDENKKTTYVKLTPEKVERIVAEHIIGKTPVTEFEIGEVKE